MRFDVSLSQIPNALETRIGIPRPDWNAIWDWVSRRVPETELHVAWSSLVADWIDQLAAALPESYVRSDSSNFVLLSSAGPSAAERLLSTCEHSLKTILDVLHGVARDEGYGKHVVLAFADWETYYDYVLDFYPDAGEFANTAGMFFDSGYGHIAMCTACTGIHDRLIAHELTHALVRHLPLPLWLDEGVTQVIEDIVVDASHFELSHEMARSHREHWGAGTIDAFWSGESFHSPDEQELSYQLAQVLFRNLVTDHPTSIKAFLNAAEVADAGNRALVDTCGETLADRVSQFLGAGDWSPRRDYAHQDE